MKKDIKDKRKQPRWFQRLRAFFGGYFWLPCHLCGEYFGGHEWSNGSVLFDTPHSGEGICDNCTEKAIRLNKQTFKKEG